VIYLLKFFALIYLIPENPQIFSDFFKSNFVSLPWKYWTRSFCMTTIWSRRLLSSELFLAGFQYSAAMEFSFNRLKKLMTSA